MSSAFRFIQEDPPEGTTGKVGRPQSPLYRAVIRHTKANPNLWFRVAEFNEPSQKQRVKASSLARAVRKMAGREDITLETRCRTVDGQVRVFVRAVVQG